jgi:uncharacterized protein YybS (DUF2232 family)
MPALALTISGGMTLLILGAFSCNKWGFRSFFVIVPALIASLFFASAHFDIFSFLILALVIGSITGFSFRFAKSLQFLLLLSSVLVFLISYAHYYYMYGSRNIDIIGETKTQLTEMIRSTATSTVEADKSIDFLNQSVSILKKIMPYYYFLNGMFMTMIGYLILRMVLFRERFGYSIQGIEKFKLNDFLIFILIAGIGAVAFSVKKNNFVFWIAMNVLLTVGTLYVVQAFGIIKHLLLKKKLPTIILPTIIVIALFMGMYVSVVTAFILAGIGVLDLWADFRGFTAKPTGPTDEDI